MKLIFLKSEQIKKLLAEGCKGTVIFDRNGEILRNSSKTYWEGKAGKLYKETVEKRFNTQLNPQ